MATQGERQDSVDLKLYILEPELHQPAGPVTEVREQFKSFRNQNILGETTSTAGMV